MGKGDQLLATIEAIHAAGLDAGRWPAALAAVTRTIGGVGTTLEIIDRTSFAHREFQSFNINPAEQLAYLQHYAQVNPRFPAALRQRAGEVSLDYDVIDERGMDRSAFYAQFLAPQDLRYCIAGLVATSGRELSVVSVQRSRRQGHVGRAEIDLMRRLIPHLGQAVDVWRRLKAASAARDYLESSLDWLADGVVLVRADGSVLYANEAMQAIARRNDGIGVRKGTIEFAAPDARRRFACALAAAVGRRGELLTVDAGDFPVRRKGAPPYVVSVRALARDHGSNARTQKADAIVFIRDPLSRDAASSRILREVFGLTEAEASLARALQHGAAVCDYARGCAISVNTVYTHLRRINEKTGTRSLAGLVRKLDDLRIPLRSG